jgi:uncharacterized protein (TIGR03437 family)
MLRFGPLFAAALLLSPALARTVVSLCGTHRDRIQEELFLHRQSERVRGRFRVRAAAPSAPAAARDIGNIAIIEDSDGVVARQNQFNLDGQAVRFFPIDSSATRYRYTVSDGGYDSSAAANGEPLAALDDDDSRQLPLPFAFPFYGVVHRQVYLNSDGNLTFDAPDTSLDRSLGRFAAGPPRIAGLLDDLDPSRTPGAVRVLADATRFVVSWDGVREWSDFGFGARQTFQIALYPDGHIDLAYAGIDAGSAVVGIAPGNLKGSTSLVSFRNEPSGEYPSAVVERFGDDFALDTVRVAQKFYETHEDAYDYLVIFNNLDLPSLASAVASEITVRNNRTGYGDLLVDYGAELGSASRLQALINMGHLSQYPRDPDAVVPARRTAGDTPLTVLGHEAGHLFLAFASVRDPNDPRARPMLGFQQAHWSFLFNSEASLLEGERIRDNGPNVRPRFITTETVEGYAPLDQYLMGFRAPEEVPPTYLVVGPSHLSQQHPARGVAIDGERRDVAIEEIIEAEGRRTPDHTVAQRRFRFAFILVVAKDSQPAAEQLEQVETLRQRFEPFFAQASSNRGFADTALQRSLKLSLYPAAGVIEGGTATASLRLQTPAEAPLTVDLQTLNGNARTPASVTIPAGATEVSFTVDGVREGVEEVAAVARGGEHETAYARVQVSAPFALRLEVVSGDRQISFSNTPLPEPIVVRITDINNLPYPGARLVASASPGGSVSPGDSQTDAAGLASFRWTPGAGASNQLRISIQGASEVSATVTAGSSVPVAAAVGNGASFDLALSPGAFGTVTGVNLTGGATAEAGFPWPQSLAGVRVLLDGRAVPLLYASDRQINFQVPPDAPLGPATLSVERASASPAKAPVVIQPVAPGIFVDHATGYGAIRPAGTADVTDSNPVAAGEYIEIYCTGLGATRPSGGLNWTVAAPTVFINGVSAPVVFSGLTGTPGLYQINARIPQGIAPGAQPLIVVSGGARSNQVKVGIE